MDTLKDTSISFWIVWILENPQIRLVPGKYRDFTINSMYYTGTIRFFLVKYQVMREYNPN